MSNEKDNPQGSIRPEEDARLPILEAQIEREWRQFRSSYVRSLQKTGQLQKQVRETALQCVKVLLQYEEAGHGADQGREAMQVFIHPQWDRS
jgi:FKBP-type peptidyl-prolyl cis-trans isomerase (trigger factor)